MVLCAAAWSVGCDSSPAVDRQPQAPPPPPTAEERFTTIVESLKRRVENRSLTASDTIGAYNGKPGTPITDATVRVSHELLPESDDGEPRRAVVCFETKSKVTVVLPQADESEKAGAERRRSREIDEMQEDLAGVADLDSLVVPSTKGLTSPLNSPVHELDQGEESRCFEMEFRDGRWELLTELDRENEPFYSLQIEFALKRQ